MQGSLILLRIVDAKTMQMIDRQAIETYAIPGHKLMEQAGLCLAEQVLSNLGSKSQSRVTVLVGGGKNGGDGLVCARYLARAGVKAKVLILSKKIVPEALENLQRLTSENIVSHQCSEVLPEEFATTILQSDIIVDALLGIGFVGDVREPFAQAIEKMNESSATVIAADVPSGLDVETGQPGRNTVRADCTVTFGLPKKGLVQHAAEKVVGQLVVETIGFPSGLLLAKQDEAMQYSDEKSVSAFLPKRSPIMHKRSVGKVLVIGGSAAYHGAPLLAALGAMRSGAGYVGIAYPKTINQEIRSHTLEAICCPLPDNTKGVLGQTALAPLLELVCDYDAVVVGPGMGNASATMTLVKNLVEKINGPSMIVIDADALNALPSVNWSGRKKQQPQIIMTPHVGEAGRVLGESAKQIQADRTRAVRELSKRMPVTVLLKGKNTLIQNKKSPLFISGLGTQALATAGSGDVLGGIIAALAAQGLDGLQASLAGNVAHSLAGRAAASDYWGQGVLAKDIIDHLPQVFAQLRQSAGRADWITGA